MKTIRSLYLIINYKTLIVTALSLVSTWLCMRYDYEANLPLTLVGIAIVFPVVFSIDSAYKRRERALALLSDFDAHMKALYMAPRDWQANVDDEYLQKFKKDMVDVYAAVRSFFVNEKHNEEDEHKISDAIDRLSVTSQKLRDYGVEVGEMSRVDQYLSKMLVAIENLKTIYFYRTPITLRAYSRVFIYSFPVLYGPYFVYAAKSYSVGLEYMMPVLFSFILVSLDNIQGHLENPFDQVGEDDIKFDVEKFERLLK
ncbi:MAG: bestrophin family ion channel [Bacteroidota bacterium]